MSSTAKSLPKTQNFNLPKHEKKIILENPLPTNQYWAKSLGGELKSYYCRSQSQKSFNPDWWRPKSSLLISINTHIHTRTRRFSTTLMKLKNQFQKISLLISINTEEFQKFLQPMMKLKNQVAHINQQSFTHPTTNTGKLKNLSLLICWIDTEFFSAKLETELLILRRRRRRRRRSSSSSSSSGLQFLFFFPFLSFFLSQCFWWNPIPQGNKFKKAKHKQQQQQQQVIGASRSQVYPDSNNDGSLCLACLPAGLPPYLCWSGI